ncbi:MAG: RpiB/LacA/LacB family sugar-phosphate isomerase [Clostridiales bacterium]|nr:RpiB/LacA/LacB family sugar-phosphate isomerase [Clostridiales bacterium]
MKIAIINEVSACAKNPDIIAALKGKECEIFNVGMTSPDEKSVLTYIHTGFISALLLNTKRVDFVVGGCGTGQGYLNSVMQYPDVFCGLICEPLDGWLFTQINGGNCISLPLNKGYGWAGGQNLKFIFKKLFEPEHACGYPAHRKESQAESRQYLSKLSKDFHISFDKIVEKMDDEFFAHIFRHPNLLKLLDVNTLENENMKSILIDRLNILNIKY